MPKRMPVSQLQPGMNIVIWDVPYLVLSIERIGISGKYEIKVRTHKFRQERLWKYHGEDVVEVSL